MLFVASKLFWALFNPLSLILLLLGAGCLLWLSGRGRVTARWLLGGGMLLLFVATLTPLDHWLMAPLEHRFATPEVLPEQVDGIVVLGGGIDVGLSRSRNRIVLGESGDRLIALARLAAFYPKAKLIYSSGYRATPDDSVTEADMAAELLEGFGIARPRLTLERRSRNTRENALYSYQVAQPRPGETWILVTSAWHLPRAVGAFRAAGWPEMIPYGVDDRAFDEVRWLGVGPLERLVRLSAASKEWIGLLAYRIFGWSETLFPAAIARR